MQAHGTQSVPPRHTALARARTLVASAVEGGADLGCLLVSVDRLGRYGDEQRAALRGAVEELVLAEPEGSGWRVLRCGDELLVLCPGVAATEVGAVARGLVEGARRKVVRAGDRELRPRISIGVAHSRKRPDLDLEVLVGVARESLGVAQAAGGDRWVHTELYELLLRRRSAGELPTPEALFPEVRELARGLETATVIPAPPGARPAVGARAAAPVPGAQRTSGATGSTTGIVGLPTELGVLAAGSALPEGPLAAARAAVAEALAGGGAVEDETVDVLERRIAKLVRALELAEGEISRLRSEVGTDSGIASIYRTVQGLQPDEPLLDAKRALMRELYRANQALQRSAS